MRRLVLLPLVSVFATAASAAVAGQSLTESALTAAAQTAPQKPAPTPAPTPSAPEPAQSAPEEVGSHSLFEPTWRQFMFGGRVTSVDGDPARFQRYQDERDGVYFSDAKFERLGPNGAWQFHATADNVGYRDQRYAASYERPGRVHATGYFDQIPQFYSVDTHTPYVTAGGVNTLDDATQRAIQNGQASLSAYIPIAPQFDLRERRDVGNVNLSASVTPTLDLTAAFTTQAHVGQLPWGASFGFSNDVEVGVPYDSRANDFTIGAEWTKPNRSMFRVAYEGSWFNNHDDALIWDSPLDLTDAVDNPGRGRMQLWPSNSAQTVSAAGYAKFAHRSQFTGNLSIGTWRNDEPLQPFTINSALPVIPLPRATTDAEARVISTNLNFVSRPSQEWRFSSRFRRYDYDNKTPATTITDYVTYDSDLGESHTGGPRLFAHNRMTFDADATYTALAPVAITAGYTNNHNGYDFRTFDSTNEHTLYVSADAVGSSMVTFRTNYEFSDRTGSGLNESFLDQIGEQPALRYYDLANRTRHKFSGQVDITPNEIWVISATAGLGNDSYPDTVLGLQDSKFRTLSLGADFRLPSAFGGGVTYTREHYDGLQRSRSAGNDAEFNSPAQDWTADSKENVDYFSIYLTPPPIARNTEVRFSYDYSYAEGHYVYGIQPGSTIPTPNQLPNVFNKLQQLNIDARHRLSGRLALTFSYLYEPFRVYDFAFDPTVVNSIVQPSSLVLGYVYRPYTAHSAVFGLLYHW